MRVRELARLLGAQLDGDGERDLRGIAALETAGSDQLTFAEGDRALERAANSRAGCILVAEGASIPGRTTLAVAHPKFALVRAAAALYQFQRPAPGVHPTAVVSPEARLGAGVSVAPHVVIERGASVGAGTCLGAGVYLGEGARVGDECLLYPRVTVYAGTRIGNRVILHSGVVAGSDGFGYVFAEGRHSKFPQLGQLIIEDDVEIGSNSTLDRGSLGTTVIGTGTKIDNLCHVAHNVTIGRHCVIAAQAGISGSASIGDYAVLAGQAGVGDHVRIEERVVVGGQAGILPGKVVHKGTTVWGTPARPLAEFKRMYAHLSHFPKLAEKVRELSRRAEGGR